MKGTVNICSENKYSSIFWRPYWLLVPGACEIVPGTTSLFWCSPHCLFQEHVRLFLEQLRFFLALPHCLFQEQVTSLFSWSHWLLVPGTSKYSKDKGYSVWVFWPSLHPPYSTLPCPAPGSRKRPHNPKVSKNTRPSTREVWKGHQIISNTVVSMIVQSLIYHWLLDTEYSFNFLDFEALDISKIQNTLFEITRDMTTRHIMMVKKRNGSGMLT